MLLAAIAIALSMQTDGALPVHCGDLTNTQEVPAPPSLPEIVGQTAHIQSSSGMVVVLKAYSTYIPKESTFLCWTNYVWEVTAPDGKKTWTVSTDGISSESGRTITIQIDGYSPDGRLPRINCSKNVIKNRTH
jgi:hypothetical protein